MALTERQARELRSLVASWNRASMAVGNLLRDGAVFELTPRGGAVVERGIQRHR